MFTCTCAQDEVTHQRLRVGSKKHALSLPEGSVQTRPEAARREGRSHFDARSVCGIREHGNNGDLPARLRVEALQRVDVKPLSAFVALRRRQGTPLACLPKLRRRHGGFFQQTPLVFPVSVSLQIGPRLSDHWCFLPTEFYSGIQPIGASIPGREDIRQEFFAVRAFSRLTFRLLPFPDSTWYP
jgi:hypothetical protein